MCPKTEKLKLSENVGGRSKQVHNVPADLPKHLRTEIWSYMAAKRNADGGEVGLISCILLQLSRYIENVQKSA